MPEEPLVLVDRVAHTAPGAALVLMAPGWGWSGTQPGGPGEPPVTCVPGPGTSLGRRWARLATALLDPAARAARILDGSPAEHADRPWYALRT
ncbi:hypothetical protein ACFWIN_33575 [Streptomyces sp. NPDC127049]|uniref:hypothetical protein n=1 Tax=Streptomyces sp. NPDC127049 TaxID=3347118 RepID=UPI003661D253